MFDNTKKTFVKLLHGSTVYKSSNDEYEFYTDSFEALNQLIKHISKSEDDQSYYSKSPLINTHRQVFLNNGEVSKHVICGEIHKYLTRYMSPKSNDDENKASNKKDLLKIAHFALIELTRLIAEDKKN